MPAADVEADQGDDRHPLVSGQLSAKEADSWLRIAVVIVVSASWMVVSSALIMLNKYIMVDLQFEYPLFVTGMGMAMSALLAFMCCRVLRIVEMRETMELRFWVQRVLPIGFLMAITLWTGNEVYLHLTVAFIQMLKAFNPVITMVCLIVAGLELPTRAMVASVLVTAAGTAAAAYGEVRMSIYGVVLMFSSETAESIRLVMTQFLLVGLNFHPIEGLMYLASTCCLWLFLGCLVVEVPHIIETGAMELVWAYPGAFLCASMMGFAVNALAYVVIKLASSLTLKVLATAKNTLLVVCGVLFFGEVVTGVQGYGYLISLTGFVWYNWLKMNQLVEPRRPPPSHPHGEEEKQGPSSLGYSSGVAGGGHGSGGGFGGLGPSGIGVGGGSSSSGSHDAVLSSAVSPTTAISQLIGLQQGRERRQAAALHRL